MKKPELLAPAGSMESLKAAICAGCDAVYLSGKKYGARSFATNFDNDELIEAIKLCHLYGIKIYVTVNTLIFEDEVEEFLNYIDFSTVWTALNERFIFIPYNNLPHNRRMTAENKT